MDAFYKTHSYLVEHTNAKVRRTLMDEIDWSSRMIGIKGTRGVGKTTFLLQYAKERYGKNDPECLYVNMNNFYFQGHGIAEFAGDFVKRGGKTLLIDQVFKKPHWSGELRECYDRYPGLRIVFTGSSVMRLEEENPELTGIVRSYNLRGLSFREYVNLMTGSDFRPYSLDEIVQGHELIARTILSRVSPLQLFDQYLHHGFYPFFLEHANFTENLLKTMNMMTEVDILLIKQIELKYLSKIKKLFYLLAVNGSNVPNISQLAHEIETSRATVMNYIKYLSDARLINIIYAPGQEFPKKPARVMLHNPNLTFAIYPNEFTPQDVMEVFFVNCLWKDHTVNHGGKDGAFIIDGRQRYRVADAGSSHRHRTKADTLYARYNTEVGRDNLLPLWLFGFLY